MTYIRLMSNHEPTRRDLLGAEFTRLKVVSFAGHTKTGGALWECVCECGTRKIVAATYLTSGTSKSCGCLRREMGRARGASLMRRHGEARNGKESVEYKTWANMISRCHNEAHVLFKNYGARG